MSWFEIVLAVAFVVLALTVAVVFQILATWLRKIEESIDEVCLLIMALDQVRFARPKRSEPGGVVRLDDYRKDV